MDAFAVAVCTGLGQTRFKISDALLVGLFFGAAQAGMPALGYLVGSGFSEKISFIDHWVAFAILVAIGGKMLVDTHKEKKNDCANVTGPCTAGGALTFSKLFLLAIATSIDALAVGVSFAFLNVKIIFAVCIIGLTTFVLSIVGVRVGSLCNTRFRFWANIAGGVMLIAIGAKILIEHLV